MRSFDLNPGERKKVFESLLPVIEEYYSNPGKRRVAPLLDLQEIRKAVRQADFSEPSDTMNAVRFVAEALDKYTVHLGHPMYYGLFNPRPNFPSIIADLLSAAYNPQLAAWSHSPFAAEAENYLISEFGKKLGFPEAAIDGVFATGGAEANITAVLCALNNAFPEVANSGLISLKSRPLIYCSSESHHSVIRAARTSGLGKDSVKTIGVDSTLRLLCGDLEKTIKADMQNGNIPFLVIGTAGTTGSGSIDNLEEIDGICRRYKLWFHVDSAWGGAAILNEESKKWIKGIELADSITLDVHKWLSVPMSASMFITRHVDILPRTFRITNDYMPRDAGSLEVSDPYSKSIQWSRRFIGLKLYLSLMVFGWEGYSEVIWHQVEMGNLLRKLLEESGWIVMNNTPLPLACFTDKEHINTPGFAKEICEKAVKSGETWISLYPVNGVDCLRACITNYNSGPADLKALVDLLNRFRSEYKNW